jgi:sugar phosphate isomerase/epimerase
VGGFALDFGHAVCTANSLDIPLDGVLKDFLSLSPAIFHLSDAPSDATKDVHLNLGKGSLDLKKLISYIPKGGMVTIETPRSASGGLQDFVDDADFLNTLIS